MDSPPANRLLQLLRQKPSDSTLLNHSDVSSSPAFDPSLSIEISSTQPDTKNSIQDATINNIQSAIIDSTQPATITNTQSASSDPQHATFDSIQPTTNNTQPAAKSGSLSATNSSTQPVAKSDVPNLAESNTRVLVTGLSKGQERVLRYLTSFCNSSSPRQTKLIGYEMISRSCSLSRNGTRKVINELIKKGIIIRSETKRGGEQGSIYTILVNQEQLSIKSSIQYSPESDIQYATLELPSSSSNKNKLLLQDLILEDAFLALNPHSLLPYLERFPSSEALQDFLDMTNACITAAKHGKGKSIQNTQGFLFAQLRAGYINPPEGYKSRKVRAHEARNQQLRDELAALQQLQEEEHQLRFTLFTTALTAEQQQRLAHEIDQRLDPKGVLSPEFQTRLLREQILQEWFAHSGGTPPVPPSCASAPADAAG